MRIQSCNALLLFLLTLAQGPRKTSGRGSHILKTVRRGTCTVSLLLDQSLWSLNWIVCSYLDFKSYISQVHASVHLGEYGCGRVPATGGTQLIPVQCHLSGTSKRRPWKRLERCRNGDEEQHWPRMCVVVEPRRTLKTVPETFRRENCLPSGGELWHPQAGYLSMGDIQNRKDVGHPWAISAHGQDIVDGPGHGDPISDYLNIIHII